ncbi:MFS transporter [Nonomuraea rubra]|uniref:MFS transporter n=1 Tax=Nonomuraea rubra TaxID=46180 RepID=UPI003133A2B2
MRLRVADAFTSSLVSTALGSLFLAPLADRIGRRALILACLVIAAGGMLLSAAAQDAGWPPGRLFLLVAAVLIAGGLAVHAFRLTTREHA